MLWKYFIFVGMVDLFCFYFIWWHCLFYVIVKWYCQWYAVVVNIIPLLLQPQQTVCEGVYQMLYGMIKLSPKLRHSVLSWIGKCIHENSGNTVIHSTTTTSEVFMFVALFKVYCCCFFNGWENEIRYEDQTSALHITCELSIPPPCFNL